MIKIIDLTFEESARLERILNKNNIPYEWDFSADWVGCIDKCYDIELDEKYATIEYSVGILRVNLWKDTQIGGVTISRADFKEVIIS